MEMHQIRYFLTLCEELNFTRAAERCDVAQSSLTRAIKSLEADLGGALFHRERGNTHLSDLGEKVKPSLERAFRHVKEAERQARDFMRERTASLRLGVMRNLAPAQPIALITAMRQRHSDISLQIVEAPAHALQDQLISDDLDAAIYALPSLDADERMNRLILDSEPFVVVVSERHRLARQGYAHIGDLQDEPYLARVDCDYEPLIREVFVRAGVAMTPTFRSERDEWILAMVAAQHGYTVMPTPNMAYPGTAAVSLIDLKIRREIALVTLSGGSERVAIDALLREAMHMTLRVVHASDVAIDGETNQFVKIAER